ncbi:MAG TPA: phosphatase PAP2 family protein [Polyangiaceae bacterium]|nr:phosphatase PAP2 family protein [Polyangiaceae bacterium]
MRRATFALGLLGLLGIAPCARAGGDCSRLAPWNRVGVSLGHYVEPVPLVLTGLSPVPLLIFAPTGLDHDLRLVAQEDLGGKYKLEPVSIWTPYVLAGSFAIGWGVSAVVGACEIQRPLSAMLQAMGGGLIVTGLLKWSVGRTWPNGGQDPHAPDRLSHPEYAQQFQPFGPHFGAWPSGHTLAMMAAASAFRASEYELGWVRFAGYPFAAAVAVGLWLGDRHWASDILSGAMLGEAIGSSVGKSFARAEDTPVGLEHGAPYLAPVAGGALVGWAAEW